MPELIPAPRLQAALAPLLARARTSRPTDWPRVWLGGARVGMARPDIARFLGARARWQLSAGALVLDDAGLDAAARSELLAEAALALRDAGLTHAWRNELLEVRAGRGAPVLAVLERAVCRSLGVTTLAVHMNALDEHGRLVVAQRAATKAIDPGLWDNLVGGMVPAGESAESALAREAWEEAGLRPADFIARATQRFMVEREVPEGWMSEAIQVFDARLAPGVQPCNQDGEVGAIAARQWEDVVCAIERGEFTLEAALTSLAFLTSALPHDES